MSQKETFVHSYTREDGTKVESHYRGKVDVAGKAAQDRDIFNKAANMLNLGPFNTFSDGRGMWDTSSSMFQNKNYMDKNALFLKNAEDLTPHYSQIIKNKLANQNMNPNSSGFIFTEDSQPSKNISNSSAISDFIKKNKNILLGGKTVSKGSVEFRPFKDFNLWGAFHYADVYEAQIDHNGDFTATLIDTYDFNKGENKYIQMARNIQEEGMLKNYFTIHCIKVPKENLSKIFSKK